MKDPFTLAGAAIILLALGVVLMWRYLLKGLLVTILIVTAVSYPFIVIPTLEQQAPVKLYALKFSAAFGGACLLCLLLYGLVSPFRCWWKEQHDASKTR